jgi:hypothetical protein
MRCAGVEDPLAGWALGALRLVSVSSRVQIAHLIGRRRVRAVRLNAWVDVGWSDDHLERRCTLFARRPSSIGPIVASTASTTVAVSQSTQ